MPFAPRAVLQQRRIQKKVPVSVFVRFSKCFFVDGEKKISLFKSVLFQGARDHVDKRQFFENLIAQAKELIRLDPELKSIPDQKPKMIDHSFAQ